jgi:hypothetical protein
LHDFLPAKTPSVPICLDEKENSHQQHEMGSVVKREPLDRLGNHIYLEKQDKLREIGVDIPTSQVGPGRLIKRKRSLADSKQIVVVGSQSSGKSSLIESVTGFSFPRGQGLCTRYATQITLRRNPVTSIVISIIPWHDSDQERKDRLREFRHELNEFDGKELATVIEKVSSDAALARSLDGINRVFGQCGYRNPIRRI